MAVTEWPQAIAGQVSDVAGDTAMTGDADLSYPGNSR